MAEFQGPDQNSAPLLAAIDLGSNSFHLIIARIEQGQICPVEREGKKIQLAANMVDGSLDPSAIARGLICMQGYRQMLDRHPPVQIRVVGTNALRVAQNSHIFTDAASEILGCEVEVIAGREEARLIYLGAAHALDDEKGSRLLIDIGGGSTEFIIGQGFQSHLLESLHLGCVTYMDRFFGEGIVTPGRFIDAYSAARAELECIVPDYKAMGWQTCVGSSGTLQAIEGVLAAQGWCEEGIGVEGLLRLRSLLERSEHIDNIQLPGLKRARRGVIVSGVAITCAIFDAFNISHMLISSGALREGIIYDLFGGKRPATK
ncbi:MAG: Ppx/GppA family phosphatase [Pseudomonadales bacterium]